MKRREFIGIAAAGLAWSATSGVPAADPQAVLATPRLLGVLPQRSMVAELGLRYRAAVPGENDDRALTHAILADVETTADAPLDVRVGDCVARDFASGRTLTINGWVVSVTEARQCALYSLLGA